MVNLDKVTFCGKCDRFWGYISTKKNHIYPPGTTVESTAPSSIMRTCGSTSSHLGYWYTICINCAQRQGLEW